MESAEMGRRHAQAGEMLPLLKRHEIQVLLRAGHSHKNVAEQTGASLDTIARVKREDDVSEVDDATERRERRIGRSFCGLRRDSGQPQARCLSRPRVENRGSRGVLPTFKNDRTV